MILLLLVLATCFLAYSNGANDNFKGVATLFGSNTTNYKTAIRWATFTTFIGSVCSIFLAETLVKNFSGKGLVPDSFAASPDFLLAVAFGAGFTVMLATITGFPISTTHSLTGALVGAGLMAVGTKVNFAVLGNSFFLPLLLSPLIAVTLGSVSYLVFRRLRISLGVTKESCLCIGETEKVVSMPEASSSLSLSATTTVGASLELEENCEQRYTGRVVGINAQKVLDVAHYISAGVVSFARGLNDTPKIVALLLAIKAIGIQFGMIAVAVGMAAGGLLNARKVAETISKKITPLNHGQGFTANLVTGLLVVYASRLGMPVSTTHVSVGSLFGIGFITKKANPRVVREILLSWVLTLPIAALLSGFIYWISKCNPSLLPSS
ncbi:anion permease [candidate division KSB1 bacterium]|nr:anion permease [candidate division KSB1 bacterium]MCH7754200.1 anion permease [candidate division KSB1 bacterium]